MYYTSTPITLPFSSLSCVALSCSSMTRLTAFRNWRLYIKKKGENFEDACLDHTMQQKYAHPNHCYKHPLLSLALSPRFDLGVRQAHWSGGGKHCLHNAGHQSFQIDRNWSGWQIPDLDRPLRKIITESDYVLISIFGFRKETNQIYTHPVPHFYYGNEVKFCSRTRLVPWHLSQRLQNSETSA